MWSGQATGTLKRQQGRSEVLPDCSGISYSKKIGGQTNVVVTQYFSPDFKCILVPRNGCIEAPALAKDEANL